MLNFKAIKPKKVNKLYQVIYNHLEYIDNLNDLDLLNEHFNTLKSYFNGYTPKDKLFKDLRKVHLNNLNINISNLILFCENKIKYLKYPNINRFIDLTIYAKETSKLAFLFLIIIENDQLNIKPFDDLAIIDIFSYILLNYNNLLKNNKIHFAKLDIKDFNLNIINNEYVVDLNLFMLWNRLAKKIKDSIDNYKKAIIFFDDCQKLLVDSYLKDVTIKLNAYSKNTFHKLTE